MSMRQWLGEERACWGGDGRVVEGGGTGGGGAGQGEGVE